jgi:aminoglycoside phosphotransferase (APT) family kinase protein
MPPDELESVLSLHVPGEGKLEFHRLGNGLVNETYRVVRGESAYVLRVAAANSYDLGLDRAWEARVLERAVAADLAPVPVYCDPQRGILITRWVDGRPWSPVDVRRQSNIARMAELMRRIHALPMPAPARLMSPAKWIEYYGAALTRHRDVSAETSASPDAQGARDLSAAAARRLKALSVLPGVAPVVCHSDLHTLNLVDRGDSLLLLDWEYAHAADPLWDLAGWSANNDLEDNVSHDLLASYTGRPPARTDYLRLQLLGWLYDYVCLLWSELYLNLHRNERPGVDSPGVDSPGADSPGAALDDPRGGVAARARLLAARLQ